MPLWTQLFFSELQNTECGPLKILIANNIFDGLLDLGRESGLIEDW